MDKYHILKTISENKGNKTVLAVDHKNNNKVVIKSYLLPPENAEKYTELCKQECYFLSEIQHPNIIQTYDLFQKGSYIFIVLEYIEGLPFINFSYQFQELSFPEKLKIALQVITAIDSINELGIIHQSLAPSSFFVRLSDRRVKLVDLGLTTPLENTTEHLAYTSPEQVLGKLCPNSNIFSLGVILYQFFIQRAKSPFSANENKTTIVNISTQSLPSLVAKLSLPHIGELAQLIDKCLQKDPSARIQTTKELKEEFEKIYRLVSSSGNISVKNTMRNTSPLRKKTTKMCQAKNSNKNTKILKYAMLSFVLCIVVISGISLYKYLNIVKQESIYNEAYVSFNKGIECYDQKEYAKAWELNNRAITLLPRNTLFLAQYARMLFYGQGTNKDITAAQKTFKEIILDLEKEQHRVSYHIVGEIYEMGLGIEKDYPRAIFFYEKAAQENIVAAMYRLGIIYEETYKEYTKALEWYQKAAEKGCGDALGQMGGMHIQKVFPSANLLDAEILLTKGAKLNSGVALNNLAYLYVNGVGVDKNIAKAVEFYEEAMKQGEVTAYENMGVFYLNGNEVVAVNLEKAITYLKYAAQNDRTSSMFLLGQTYETGEKVTKDYAEAFNWYERAASKEHPRAMYRLALLYWNGYGVRKDRDLSIYWFTKAADKNLEISIVELINIYINLIKDPIKAFYWAEKGANLGNVKAINVLGQMYLNGVGTTQNVEQAIIYYKNAALNGHIDSMYQLGVIYREGLHVTQNYLEALKWLQQAAKNNHPEAYNELGYMYMKALGVTKNSNNAINLFQKSAELGYSVAMYNLGQIFEFGMDVEKNEVLAKQWYEKAVSLGDKQSLSALEKMSKK